MRSINQNTVPSGLSSGQTAVRVLYAIASSMKILAESQASCLLAYERFSGNSVHPDADRAAWLPGVPGPGVRLIRSLLQRTLSSPLVRAEVEALLHHAWQIERLVSSGFQPALLLETAANLAMCEVAPLLSEYPGKTNDGFSTRTECGEMLSLFAAEVGCLGQSFSPLISEDTLQERASSDQEYSQLINTMRLYRLQSSGMDPWKAEAFFPKLTRARSKGHLYFTIGAPQITHVWNSAVEVDMVLSAQDIQKVRHPAWRRRQLVERVRGALAHGRRVLCIANHSTQASRRELLHAARALGAPVTALYYDWPEEAIDTRVEQSEAPVTRRTLTRVLETLEPPRPHEADAVLVLGPEGPIAQWKSLGTLEGGFVESILTPSQTEGLCELSSTDPFSLHTRLDTDNALTLTPLEQSLLLLWCTALEGDQWGRPLELLQAPHPTLAEGETQSQPELMDWDDTMDSSDD